jgi:hypothetical protein
MLYSFFWVIPRRLNFMFRRFGPICLFLLKKWCKQDTKNLDAGESREEFFVLIPPKKMEQRVPKRRNKNFRRRGMTQKKEYNTLYHNCIYNRLPEDELSGSKHVEGINN